MHEISGCYILPTLIKIPCRNLLTSFKPFSMSLSLISNSHIASYLWFSLKPLTRRIGQFFFLLLRPLAKNHFRFLFIAPIIFLDVLLLSPFPYLLLLIFSFFFIARESDSDLGNYIKFEVEPCFRRHASYGTLCSLKNVYVLYSKCLAV